MEEGLKLALHWTSQEFVLNSDFSEALDLIKAGTQTYQCMCSRCHPSVSYLIKAELVVQRLDVRLTT
jgi:hypothetical protein